MKKTAIITLVSLVLVGGVVSGGILMHNKSAEFESDNQMLDIATGEQLYQNNCASCHGVNLEGQPNWRSRNADGSLPAPPHDATGHTWHHDDETLFYYTKLGGKGIAELRGYNNPNSAMPAYADILSDSEIIAILEYIKSTWPQQIRAMQSARSAK